MTGDAPAREFRIRSVEDLLPLLEHADPEVRAATFSSLLADPDKAMALASDRNRDIVDVFIDRLERPLPQRDKVPLLSVLGQFNDNRVAAFFRGLLLRENSDELLHIAARYVSDTGLEIPVEELLHLLRSHDSMSRNRIAATLLHDYGNLSCADRIRVAAFSSGTSPFPPLDSETAGAWQQQLDSPLRDYLCLVLETRGPALEDWEILWPALEAELQDWLVRRACHHSPPVDTIIQLGLASPREAVRSSTTRYLRLYGLAGL